MKKVLLTGSCGFAGAHILRHVMETTDWHVLALDRLTYAGDMDRISEYRQNPRLTFIYHDFRAQLSAGVLRRLEGTDYIIHNGAESDVSRSLSDPEPFVQSNVVGTFNMLEAAKKLGCERYVQVSTDEVLGPAPEGTDHIETDPIRPSNPYSAAKAGAEALAYAYFKSYRVPTVISRTMNLMGERQHVEKMVPMTIRKVLAGEVVTIHGNAEAIGSRKWLHARNQAAALCFLLTNPAVRDGETYHVAGDEKNNLEIATLIAAILGRKLEYEMLDFHAVRLGHDRRYSLDDRKLRALGWKPQVDFLSSLQRTVEWTVRPENRVWLEG